MMLKPPITAELATGEILNKWPETITAFREFHMNCIGCYMSVFDTLEDAAIVHNISVEEIVAALNEQISDVQIYNTEENDE